PNQFNGTVLLGEEWRDNAQLRYNLFPLELPEKCDGCGVKLCVEHALSCKVGGMVHIQHDNVAQEFVFLCGKAFEPSRVSYEPLINTRGAQPAANGNANNNQANGNNNRAKGVKEEALTAVDERADPNLLTTLVQYSLSEYHWARKGKNFDSSMW
ncbi:hypothetical protein ACHAXN_005644, partial [Cyclotella atomus]